MDFLAAVDTLQQQLSNPKRKDNATKSSGSHASDLTVPWDWVAIKLSNLLLQYPAGLTEAIVLTELESQWVEAEKEYHYGLGTRYHSIDMIYNGNFSRDCIIEVTIEKNYFIQGTRFMILVASDKTSVKKIEIFLHQKFAFLAKGHVQTTTRNFLESRKVKLAVVGVSSSLPATGSFTDSQSSNDEKAIGTSMFPRIPPTEHLVFMLSPIHDKAFVFSQFSMDVLSDVSVNGNRRYKLWLKILHIEKAVHTSSVAAYGNKKGQYLKIYLSDTSDECNSAILTLYDHQLPLAGMLQKSDFIGLFHPGIASTNTASQRVNGGSVLLEYAVDTVIFCMTEKDAESADLTNLMKKRGKSSESGLSGKGSSQFDDSVTSQLSDLANDGKDVIDCRMYNKRIYIKNLRPQMINITLFGRIAVMANNSPYRGAKGEPSMDRYAIRLVDETAQIDITLWEAVGHRARRFREGNHILISGLTTSKVYKNAKGGVTWYVNGSTNCDTKIVNVSTIKCLLASSYFRKIVALNMIRNYEQCQVCAVVTGWYISDANGERRLWEGELNEADGTVLESSHSGVRLAHTKCYGHKACLRSVIVSDEGQPPYCKFCACSIYHQHELVRIFAGELDEEGAVLYWSLDDGTEEVTLAEAGQEVIADFLNMSATQFVSLTIKEQLSALDLVVGKEYWMSLNQVAEGCWRIESVEPTESSLIVCHTLIHEIAGGGEVVG